MRKRALRSAAPLLLLLIIVVLVNTISPERRSSQPEPETAASNFPTQIPPATSRPPILPATILPSPTAAATPQSDILQAAGTILLYGPPPAATLLDNGNATFYWGYSEPLPAGHQLVLTLRQNSQVWARQALAAPNFGTGFQIKIDFAEIGLTSGTVVWQVALQVTETQSNLLTSEERPLILIGE